MKKRILINILLLCLLLSLTVPAVMATEVTEVTEAVVRADNECGEGIFWSYDEGVLTITGDGEMDDFEEGAPWAVYKDEMTELVIEGELTYIGANAFRDHDALETVDFGEALYEIGTEAFASCDALVSIELPASFKVFGEGSFMSCEKLEEIHCAGKFPSFRQNCLWATYVNIYYPVDRPWNVENIQQLEEAFKGRVEFLAEDGTDHYVPTEAPTEPEETVPETTVPETEAPETVAPTETEPPVTEAPATEAPTEPVVTEAPTEATEAAQEPTAADEPAEKSGLDGISVGLIIVGAVMGLLILGALAFSGKFRGKGRYTK